MITGPEIERQVKEGNIDVTPYDPAKVGCNSLDVTLGNTIYTYNNRMLRDVRRKYKINGYVIEPKEGLTLYPNILYMAQTVESISSTQYSIHVTGLSSLAKHGMTILRGREVRHVGHKSNISLCLTVVEPVQIYPNIRIAQVWFDKLIGETREYTGRYKGREGLVGSLSYEDFEV